MKSGQGVPRVPGISVFSVPVGGPNNARRNASLVGVALLLHDAIHYCARRSPFLALSDYLDGFGRPLDQPAVVKEESTALRDGPDSSGCSIMFDLGNSGPVVPEDGDACLLANGLPHGSKEQRYLSSVASVAAPLYNGDVATSGAALQSEEEKSKPTVYTVSYDMSRFSGAVDSGQQLLIPLGQSDLQPGNTVLLPIVPAVLPDGCMDVRVAPINLPYAAATKQQRPVGNVVLSESEDAGSCSTSQQQPQMGRTFILLINGANGTTTDLRDNDIGIGKQSSSDRQEPTGDTVSHAINIVDMPKTVFLVDRSGAQSQGDNLLMHLVVNNGNSEQSGAAVVESGKSVPRGKCSSAKTVVSKPISVAPSDAVTVYRCEFCDYSNAKRYLLVRHMKSHSEDRPYKCTECDRCFKTNSSLQNHINTHIGFRPHQCKRCELAFTTSGELIRHIRYRHTLEKPHKCTECSYASVELSKLKRHMRSHTGERPYQCSHCKYASPDTYKLKRHMRVHTGEKPYQCDVCQQRFTQSNSLKAHKLIHSGARPVYHCKFCPSSCGRKTDLKIHIQKLHTSAEQPLLCGKCKKTFDDRYTLKMHYKEHEGKRGFQCERCPFTASSQRHVDLHHSVHADDQRLFKCAQCCQSFHQMTLLRKHMKAKHNVDFAKQTSRNVCDKCGEGFPLCADLKRHNESTHPVATGYHVISAEPGTASEMMTSGVQPILLTPTGKVEDAVSWTCPPDVAFPKGTPPVLPTTDAAVAMHSDGATACSMGIIVNCSQSML